ncbi:hypothetical protein J6590_024883 [Homalodisca vitripennis]|nr:hypothetical protein J6590_024883 [Homalodisca vitripennis]
MLYMRDCNGSKRDLHGWCVMYVLIGPRLRPVLFTQADLNLADSHFASDRILSNLNQYCGSPHAKY